MTLCFHIQDAYCEVLLNSVYLNAYLNIVHLEEIIEFRKAFLDDRITIYIFNYNIEYWQYWMTVYYYHQDYELDVSFNYAHINWKKYNINIKKHRFEVPIFVGIFTSKIVNISSHKCTVKKQTFLKLWKFTITTNKNIW